MKGNEGKPGGPFVTPNTWVFLLLLLLMLLLLPLVLLLLVLLLVLLSPPPTPTPTPFHSLYRSNHVFLSFLSVLFTIFRKSWM